MRCIPCASGSLGSRVTRSHSLRLRLGIVIDMAKVIEFYIPEKFRKTARWIPLDQRGKVIEFPVPDKKSA